MFLYIMIRLSSSSYSHSGYFPCSIELGSLITWIAAKDGIGFSVAKKGADPFLKKKKLAKLNLQHCAI